MDRADLRQKLIETFDDIAGRTWVVPAETRRLARAAKRCTEERDDWVDVLLEFVNKTYEPEPETAETAMPEDKPTLSAKATEISEALGQVGYTFSPMIIIALLGLLLQLFMACRQSPAQARKRAANPRLLDRIALRRLIRQHAGEEDEDALEAAVLDAGARVTLKEMTALYAETGQEPE